MRKITINTISSEGCTYPITFYTASSYYAQENIRNNAMSFHQILLILDGTGTLYCNGKHYALQKGCAFFTASGIAVEYINNGGLISAFLTAKGSAADALAENFSDHGLLFLENADLEKHIARIRRLIADYHAGCDQGALSAQAYSFFVDFLSQQKTNIPIWLNETVKFIHLHFDEKLTLDTLAKHAYISVSKLGHEFKKHYGTSVFEYIMDVRLRYAHELLCTSPEIMTKSVAVQCGFSDCGYFCKAYRKKYGKTPSAEKNGSRASKGKIRTKQPTLP